MYHFRIYDLIIRGDMVFKKFSETTEPKRSTHGKGVYEPHGADWEPSTLYVYEIFPRKYPKNLFWVPATPKQHFHTPQRLATAAATTGMVATVAPVLVPTAAAAAAAAAALSAAATTAAAVSAAAARPGRW